MDPAKIPATKTDQPGIKLFKIILKDAPSKTEQIIIFSLRLLTVIIKKYIGLIKTIPTRISCDTTLENK